MSDLVQMGTVIEPYGTVVGVSRYSHERYYWLIDKHKVVSMMPAEAIEKSEEAKTVKDTGGDAIRALTLLGAIVGYVDRNGELDPGYKHEALALIETALAASEAAALREAAGHFPFGNQNWVGRCECGWTPTGDWPHGYLQWKEHILALITPAQAAALEKVIQSAKRNGREEMRNATIAVYEKAFEGNWVVQDTIDTIRALPLDPEVPR